MSQQKHSAGKVSALLGMQWGDEGKGKLVDALSKDYDVVCRFQGGPNAGHTIYIGEDKHVLHQIPSGVLQGHTENLIANGVVLDPLSFHKEAAAIEAMGIPIRKRLFLSKGTHLILPTHILLDKKEEKRRYKQFLGSTLKGIGPCYQDKAARHGLRIVNLHDRDFHTQYATLTQWHKSFLDKDLLPDKAEEQSQTDALAQALDYLRGFPAVDGHTWIEERLRKGKNILAEGAQGALLDIDHGTYPFVTSSHTGTGGLCTGLGVAPQTLGKIYGVFKAYTTRVGSGPFPSEVSDKEAAWLRDKGHEFGATTGRARRCGWLDLPALRYAVRLNGIDSLFMTKVDVLSQLAEIKVCIAYKEKETLHTCFSPYLPFEKLQPVYKTFPSWRPSDFKNDTSLPAPLEAYVHFIEQALELRIGMISYGVHRNDLWQR